MNERVRDVEPPVDEHGRCLEMDGCMHWGTLGVQSGTQKPMGEFCGNPKGKAAATHAGGTEHLVENGMSK